MVLLLSALHADPVSCFMYITLLCTSLCHYCYHTYTHTLSAVQIQKPLAVRSEGVHTSAPTTTQIYTQLSTHLFAPLPMMKWPSSSSQSNKVTPIPKMLVELICFLQKYLSSAWLQIRSYFLISSISVLVCLVIFDI